MSTVLSTIVQVLSKRSGCFLRKNLNVSLDLLSISHRGGNVSVLAKASPEPSSA